MEEHQGGHGGDAAHGGQDLAHPEGTPVEAVHPQALDHGPAQAIPGCVAQGDLAVVGPLGVEVIQEQKAAEVPQALIEERRVHLNVRTRDGRQAHAPRQRRLRAEGLAVHEVAPAADALPDEQTGCAPEDWAEIRRLVEMQFGERFNMIFNT